MKTMDDYVKKIVYSEGWKAYQDKILSVEQNPYHDVSHILAAVWYDGYWDSHYYEDCE